ncbi:MAG: DNA-binding protein [Rhodospirillaceae bacterium]|nr:DNA-binding protein [Rhodospirillaceae bacterium]|tara:strand:+ start:200 stop:517 length:318 start_codon:yes stop_codon:yes gene_type:complete
MESTEGHFIIGQVVRHVLFDYRGVIFDVDPCFSGTQDWYVQVARSKPPKDKPWYHVMVNDEIHTTYVAERHLEVDKSGRPIKHILLGSVFGSFVNGVYIPKLRTN